MDMGKVLKTQGRVTFSVLCPSVTKFKTKNILELLKLEVIMVGNLKTKNLNYFLMRMESLMISLVLEMLNKMEL